MSEEHSPCIRPEFNGEVRKSGSIFATRKAQCSRQILASILCFASIARFARTLGPAQRSATAKNVCPEAVLFVLWR
jgi:hypothetical protein